MRYQQKLQWPVDFILWSNASRRLTQMRSLDFCSVFWRPVFQILLSHPAVTYVTCFASGHSCMSSLYSLSLHIHLHSQTSTHPPLFFYFVFPETALQLQLSQVRSSPASHLGCRKVSIWSTRETFPADMFWAHSSLWLSEVTTATVLLVPCIPTWADWVILRDWYSEACVDVYAL